MNAMKYQCTTLILIVMASFRACYGNSCFETNLLSNTTQTVRDLCSDSVELIFTSSKLTPSLVLGLSYEIIENSSNESKKPNTFGMILSFERIENPKLIFKSYLIEGSVSETTKGIISIDHNKFFPSRNHLVVRYLNPVPSG